MTALTKNIKVSPEFKSWLDKQGRRGETMEQVLKRLLKWDHRMKIGAQMERLLGRYDETLKMGHPVVELRV